MFSGVVKMVTSNTTLNETLAGREELVIEDAEADETVADEELILRTLGSMKLCKKCRIGDVESWDENLMRVKCSRLRGLRKVGSVNG